MLRTILILLFTIIVVPLCTIYFAEPLSSQQIEILKNAASIALFIALACFVISELSKNYSQVDKIWSVAPIIYVWYVAWAADWNSRAVLMAVLVSIWGIRLTLNFARRGGYSWKFWEGDEDYRWAVLRQKPILNSPWKWRLFNLFFISLYQNALIFLFTVPIIAVVQETDPVIGLWDIGLALAFLEFVVIETIADQQQWNFQTKKYALLAEGKSLSSKYAKGFIDTGLWGISRHPNYMAEQSIWIVFYLFSVVATGDLVNWTMPGCLLLLILFKGSSDFSEEISASKYPAYAAYQQKVGRFLPKVWG